MPLPIPSNLLTPLPLSGQSPATALWIFKTANLFRGVIELDCTSKGIESSAELVRAAVAAEYKPGRIVPFAFGTILRYRSEAPTSEQIETLVDDVARAKGTWQWIIAIDEESQQVRGVHMWARGYLTPVYETLMKHYESEGRICSSQIKSPGRFWTRLWNITKALLQARQVLISVGAVLVVVTLLVRLLSKA
jgi:hypothetical protein